MKSKAKKNRVWPWLLAAPLLALPLWAAAAYLCLGTRWGAWLSEAVTAALKVVLIP